MSEALDGPLSMPTSVDLQSVIESVHINESPDCHTETNPTRSQTREEVDGRSSMPTPVVPQSVVQSRNTADNVSSRASSRTS
ncbi:hypothetical protein BD410DRAFT_365271 [Rickenella mellea]|uniref:Uncharacterized protein n=1 Tax=Rickenella mellea TaxID=50990 RepID=A0A4Y7PEF0_9AGAM|nr:hypothetical protein BD410DRAFT_365271 [Rickenella mellea]